MLRGEATYTPPTEPPNSHLVLNDKYVVWKIRLLVHRDSDQSNIPFIILLPTTASTSIYLKEWLVDKSEILSTPPLISGIYFRHGELSKPIARLGRVDCAWRQERSFLEELLPRRAPSSSIVEEDTSPMPFHNV